MITRAQNRGLGRQSQQTPGTRFDEESLSRWKKLDGSQHHPAIVVIFRRPQIVGMTTFPVLMIVVVSAARAVSPLEELPRDRGKPLAKFPAEFLGVCL